MSREVVILTTAFIAAAATAIAPVPPPSDGPPQPLPPASGDGLDVVVSPPLNNTDSLMVSEEEMYFHYNNLFTGRKGCSPTKSCVRAGGHCVQSDSDCDGKVDKKGCNGGKKCRCCIPDQTTPSAPPTIPAALTSPPPITSPGCIFDYAVYHEGESIIGTCLTLECQGAKWVYKGKPASNTCAECKATGDPHIYPYDPHTYSPPSNYYTTHEEGDFALTQTYFENVPFFGVNIKTERCVSSCTTDHCVSCVVSVTYSEPDITVKMVAVSSLTKIKIYVNKQESPIGHETIAIQGKVLIFKNSYFTPPHFCISIVGSKGFSVTLCDHTGYDYPWVHVHAIPSLKFPISQLYGLCDTLTGNNQTSFTKRNKYKDPSADSVFVESWTVEP